MAATFSVMSYNVLSHRETEKFKVYCKPGVLDVDNRRKKLIEEIRAHEADIICLQEVDHLDFEDCYKKELSDTFQFFYYPIGRDKILTREIDSTNAHGSMIMFHKNKFKYVGGKFLDYRKLVNEIDKKIFTYNFEKKFTRLMNVGLMAVLEENFTKEKIVIGNTHLYWHPSYDPVRDSPIKVRLMQLKILTSNMERMAKILWPDKDPKVILCGDFNSQPHSAAYRFIDTGHISGSDQSLLFEKNAVVWGDLKHSLHLKSGYADTIGEPLFTNYTDTFKGTLDYIWYNKPSFIPLEVKPLIDEEAAKKETALPNSDFPSDHLSIYMKFGLV